MGRTIRLRGPNRLGRTIHRRGPNPSWAEPSGTRRFVVFNIFSTLSYVIVKSVSSAVLSSVLSNVGIFSRPFLGEDTREVGIPYLRQPQAQLWLCRDPLCLSTSLSFCLMINVFFQCNILIISIVILWHYNRQVLINQMLPTKFAFALVMYLNRKNCFHHLVHKWRHRHSPSFLFTITYWVKEIHVTSLANHRRSRVLPQCCHVPNRFGEVCVLFPGGKATEPVDCLFLCTF